MNTKEALQGLVDDVINSEGASEGLKLRAMNIMADMEKNVVEEEEEQQQPREKTIPRREIFDNANILRKGNK